MEILENLDTLKDQNSNNMENPNEALLYIKLAITAASRISEKINKALGDPETAGRRWFWELLQNAKDCASYNPNKSEQEYKNVKDKTVDVILTYSSVGEDYYLTFEHNGNPFSYTEDRYKLNDVDNLILPNTGKDNEYQTGKFGTGFLSTHILALKIRVEGVFLNKENKLKDFNFIIDRTKFTENNSSNDDNRRNLFIDSIVDAQRNSVKYEEHKNIINSKFTYYLNENIKHDINWVKKFVEDGLKDLDVLLPFVLCFNKEVKSVTINNKITNSSTSYELAKGRVSHSTEMQLFHYSVLKNQEIINILLAESDDIQLATYFKTGIPSENKFFINLAELYKQKTQKKATYLFSSFPLIGSEDFSFPMIINSKKFKPNESRDCISLKDNDSGNQTIIEKASKLYIKLLANISNEKWKWAFNISDTLLTIPQNHKWISDGWHKTNVNSPMRESILKEKLVDIPTNKNQIAFIRKPIKENENQLYFPMDTNNDKLWKYAIDLFPQSVPSFKEVSEWNKVLWESKSDFKIVNSVLLIKEISKYKNDIPTIATQIFGDNENAHSEFINWLHDFVYFIKSDPKQNNYLDMKNNEETFPILLNRKGELKLLSELYYDKGCFEEKIDGKTLELLEEFCEKNKTGELLDKRFDDLNILPVGRNIKEEDLIREICSAVNIKINENNLNDSDKSSLSELRNYIFNISNEIYEVPNVEKEKKIGKFVQLYSAIDLNKIVLSVLEPDKISILTKLSDLDREKKIDLKVFEHLAEHIDIIVLVEKLVAQQEKDNREFKEKKELGNFFETLFNEKVASYKYLKITQTDGEEDFYVINSMTNKDFYVEIKSATNHKTYVDLTPNQGGAFSRKDNYILCIIPDSNLVTDESSFIEKAIFNKSIGQLLKNKVQSIVNFETKENGIEIIFETELLKNHKKYKYKYRINESNWNNNNFDDFLNWMKA